MTYIKVRDLGFVWFCDSHRWEKEDSYCY